jgi:chromosome segregation ATPase
LKLTQAALESAKEKLAHSLRQVGDELATANASRSVLESEKEKLTNQKEALDQLLKSSQDEQIQLEADRTRLEAEVTKASTSSGLLDAVRAELAEAGKKIAVLEATGFEREEKIRNLEEIISDHDKGIEIVKQSFL